MKNRHLHIYWDQIKQDIDTGKQDIGVRKQDEADTGRDIVIPCELSGKTGKNILLLRSCLGAGQVFGRTQVMEILHITASPASELIRKMLVAFGLIVPVAGSGKGKYRFA